ncbi:MAG: radical SAM protein [Defluviitaleaceae bacterium]|nr:radical SAM protein [Defluviitaleaceae bacterium]
MQIEEGSAGDEFHQEFVRSANVKIVKISPYLNLKRIEFVMTYQCSGHCKHCSFGEKINSKNDKHVSARHASQAIEELAKIFPITSAMAFGGEPLLYAEETCEILATAARCGIEGVELITNGFFTKDDARCKEVATALKAAGVTAVMISVDAFHQETIPLEAVYTFARYVKEAKIPYVDLHPAWVVDKSHDNPYNVKTQKILSAFADLNLPVSSGNNIFPAGNAAKFLAEYYDAPKLNLSDTCGSVPYTDPLTNITSLSIVPGGDVMVCGGFAIGNVQNIRETIADYDPHKNELMHAVVTGGAAGLLAFSEKMQIDTSQCRSVCDLCRLISNVYRATSENPT